MFTGIVIATGRVESLSSAGEDCRMRVACDCGPKRLRAGDSVAVSGVCLTALNPDSTGFSADVSGETLACTTLGELSVGDAVNVEPALAAGEPLGGHIVTGHVDGVGRVRSLEAAGRSTTMWIELPAALARYIAPKGSVCVDGVSLTVNLVREREFSVNIIPHTRETTTFVSYESGSAVNIEIDLVARYIDRLLAARDEKSTGETNG